LAADFSGRSYFYRATFVFGGRNFGQLATLIMVNNPGDVLSKDNWPALCPAVSCVVSMVIFNLLPNVFYLVLSCVLTDVVTDAIPEVPYGVINLRSDVFLYVLS
jgi:hypothetical protein